MPRMLSISAIPSLHTIGDLANLLQRIDYQDAFRMTLPRECDKSLPAIAHAILATPPGVVQRLMALRNTLVRPLGLKTAPENAPCSSSQQPSSGFLKSLSEHKGPDDKSLLYHKTDAHLDFVLAIHRSGTDDDPCIDIATCVQFNKPLGRFYFAIVKPFHKWIVPQCMQSGLQRIGATTE